MMFPRLEQNMSKKTEATIKISYFHYFFEYSMFLGLEHNM